MEIKAQVCTGTLGDPVINIDFGSGSNTFGPALPVLNTNYNYVAGTPNDGEYTIAKTTFGMNNGWFQINNHTPNNTNGYIMIVNASNNPGIFYQKSITGLCPGTTYEFTAWVSNILNYSANKPNITFRIETTAGIILKSYNTGDILETQLPTWKKYATNFTTSSNADIVLKLINNGPGGIGNDLAIDDITFRPCGPVITPRIGSTSTPTANMCAGETKSFNLSANISAGYIDPVYQWQVLSGTNWLDIGGQTTTQTTVNFINAAVGVYKYRLLAAERANINSANCRIASEPLTINVNAKPDATTTNSGPACVGGSIQLTAPIGSGYSYEWTGPNNFTSQAPNPRLDNVTLAHAGTYVVKVFNAATCFQTGSTQVQVLNPVIATTDIAEAILCKNKQIKVTASGGTSYSWSPVDGLSDPNIANPIIAPTKNTIYTVTVSNGACSSTIQVDIKIAKEVSANAGENKQIIAAQSISLNGFVDGDNILRYYWTPQDYLDDPNKLNPIATPPNDITYTLHAESNCGTATSSLFLKVYPKIEIPTMFSPNGDGKNDTWIIPGMGAFDKPRLKVVNRYGQIVFKSNDSTPWDGKNNGKDLPTGIYYYTLYLSNDLKTYSGWIFLIR